MTSFVKFHSGKGTRHLVAEVGKDHLGRARIPEGYAGMRNADVGMRRGILRLRVLQTRQCRCIASHKGTKAQRGGASYFLFLQLSSCLAFVSLCLRVRHSIWSVLTILNSSQRNNHASATGRGDLRIALVSGGVGLLRTPSSRPAICGNRRLCKKAQTASSWGGVRWPSS